jgi:competence protein ComEC
MTLVFLCAFWLVGIYLGSLVHIDAPVVVLSVLPALAVAILWRRNAGIRLVALCLIALIAGIVRYQIIPAASNYGSIAAYIGPRPVEVGAVVVAEPDIRDTDIRLVVDTYHVGNGQDSYSVSGAVQVLVPRYTSYRYGDDLLLKGTLEAAPVLDTFNYKEYLVRQGIFAVMYHPQIDIVARDQGNRVMAELLSAKLRLQAALQQYLPEPQAGLAQGVLLGVRAIITDDLKEDLQRTGLTHILVVSGYNLTVVAILLQRLTEKRLPRHLALLIALGGVILFTLMTGGTPPVVRAAIMVSMALLARVVGRESDALTSLMLTAALLVGASPGILWDVSFQLSFMATLGLVLLSPPLERALRRLPLGIDSILATALAAAIMTTPVIAFNFQRISLISPLANLLVAPAVPLLMLLGAIVAILGLTGLAFVRVFGWMTWLVGTYMVQVMHTLGGLPDAAVDLPTLPPTTQSGVVLAYCGVIALFLFVSSYVHRSDISAAPRQAVAALRSANSKLVLGTLAALAVAVWVVALLLLRGNH